MIANLTVAVQAIVVCSAILIVEELLRAISTRGARSAGAPPSVVRDIGYAFRFVAAACIISAIFSVTGIASEFTALTFSGIAALAISLTLQTTLSNVISGILLFHDGALRLDDEIEYGGVKGKVARLALRNTWLRTEAGNIVVVSNSSLANGPMTNHSAAERLSRKYALGEQTTGKS